MTSQRGVGGGVGGLPPERAQGAGASPVGGVPDAGDVLSPWYPDLDDESDVPEAGPFVGEDDELPEGIVELDDETDVPPVEPVDGDDVTDDAGDGAGSPTGDAPVPPARRPGKRMVKPEWREKRTLEPAERVLVLDTWQRSGLAATDFAPLVQISAHTLRSWQKKFEELGPEGLVDAPHGRAKGSQIPEATKRAIIMLKEMNPDFGTQRISDMLTRGPALAASAGTVARILKEAGYVTEDVPVPQHPDHQRSFQRETPNDLWQTDLFTFTMKRTNRRVYLVAFMDDHSRFVTSFALHASASTGMVIEALEAGITSYGPPAQVLTDNGPQYVTWRGKSAFAKECDRRGITQIVSRPRHPETLGKIERFWGSLWRECLERAMLADLGEARGRIGQYVDYYNFQRPSQALDGLVPADRFFKAAPEVYRTLKARVAANALELARNGQPKTPFYLTGNVGGKSFSVHAEGERIMMRRGDEEPREVELTPSDAAPPVPAGRPAPDVVPDDAPVGVEIDAAGDATGAAAADATFVEPPTSPPAPVDAKPQAVTASEPVAPFDDRARREAMAAEVRRVVQSLLAADRK